jgi:hypothetical protein
MDAGQQNEATINPDGSSSYDAPPVGEAPPVTEPLGAADSSPPTIDPTTTFGAEDAEGGGSGDGGNGGFFDDGGDGMPNFDDIPPVAKPASGIDPAVYLILAFVAIVAIYWFFFLRKKSEEEEDDFFASIDGDKVRRLCNCLELVPLSIKAIRRQGCGLTDSSRFFDSSRSFKSFRRRWRTTTKLGPRWRAWGGFPAEAQRRRRRLRTRNTRTGSSLRRS